jgi:hypothetical protein
MTLFGLFNRMRLRGVQLFSRQPRQLDEVVMDDVEFFLGQRFHVDQPIAGTLDRRNQLVELEMNRERILVL